MGIAEWFNTFCSNIQIQDRSLISLRYRSITQRLNRDFWDSPSETWHSLYVGSYGRHTAIEGFSDLDMIFELPPAKYHQYNAYTGNGQSALLQEVRQSIRRTYPSTDIGADGQVVQVSFSDNLMFEVVPAFLNSAGGYKFPDSNQGGQWKDTNPKPEIEAIRDMNNACNNNLMPLCRMMRAWKDRWNVPIGGLLIDTLAYQFIDNWQYKDKSYFYYGFMCRDFFNFVAGQDRTKQYWRAPGSWQCVWRKGPFEAKAGHCYELALDAIRYQNDGNERAAKQTWRTIFGTAFPL